MNLQTKKECHVTQVSHLKNRFHFLFEELHKLNATSNDKKIIYTQGHQQQISIFVSSQIM
ncbi:hypothetical protein Sjap_004877 [Stephania japonica]|uniref:Uncharacterized protein n=1 Tax=Stephania japonica TaxID=461633 RepID=A0AAP0K4D1_9MAGN